MAARGEKPMAIDISLRLYPADTLSQARQLYPRIDERTRDQLVELDASPGWSVQPNFHLGVRTRGWLDDTSPVGLAGYLEHWHAHIDEQGQRPTDEWPAILNRLARERIVSASYPKRFREQVGGRAAIHPRPGILITRSWPLYAAKHLDLDKRFAIAVRTAINQSLKQIGERPLDR